LRRKKKKEKKKNFFFFTGELFLNGGGPVLFVGKTLAVSGAPQKKSLGGFFLGKGGKNPPPLVGGKLGREKL